MPTSKISANYNGSATLYAIVRRITDGKVWDVANTTFATWADGDIDNYDVALPSLGGDLYQADFPTDIASGTFVKVFTYVQAGGSPATTDLLLNTEEFVWNGATLDSGSSVALLSYALTTLNGLKRQLGISLSDTSQDTWLTELINAATERIEREAGGRRFAATDYIEWYTGAGEDRVIADQYPIIRVNAVATGSRNAITVSYSGSAVYAQVIAEATNLRLLEIAADGTTTTNDLSLSTYPTASTLATAITAVSGWSATLDNDGRSRHIRPVTVSALDADHTLQSAWDYAAPTSIDKPLGEVAFRATPGSFSRHLEYGASRDIFGGGAVYTTPAVPHGEQNVMIDYRAGYETIPDDIDQIAREFAAQMYHLGSKNTALQSESLGSYSYTLASQLDVTESMRVVLGRYTREVFA